MTATHLADHDLALYQQAIADLDAAEAERHEAIQYADQCHRRHLLLKLAIDALIARLAATYDLPDGAKVRASDGRIVLPDATEEPTNA